MENIPTTPLAIIGTVVIVLAMIVVFLIRSQSQQTRANDVSDRSEGRSDRSEGRNERSEIRNNELEQQMISLMSDIKAVIAGNTEAIRDSRVFMQLLSAGQEQSLRKLDALCDHASDERGNWQVALKGLNDIQGAQGDMFKELRRET